MTRNHSVLQSTLDPDALEAEARIAFPVLTEKQIQRVAALAKEREFADGDALWQVGDRGVSFHVIVSGAVEIRQPLAGSEPRAIVTHGPGGFTGDIDLLSSKSAVVAGVAAGATTTLVVCSETLKKLVVSDPEISDVLLAAFLARRRLLIAQRHGEITLVGSRYSPQLYALRDFLERNSRPFNWIDLETDPAAAELLDSFQLQLEDTPAVLTSDGGVCRNPTVECLAERLGLSDLGSGEIYDMAVVGAGPAGLAAAVYGGSEGLSTIVLDAHAPGGQAGTSSKIENYLGFPMGISGADLAQNALVQAEKFGVRLATPRRVEQLVRDGSVYRLDLANGDSVRARAVVAASGVRYRRLPAENAQCFEGRGIYFAATRMEADLCDGSDVAIVGGGNSAGQAAVYLATRARSVAILVRSAGLEHSMSRYLIDRIGSLGNVTLHPHTEIQRFSGEDRLRGITVRDNRTDVTSELPVTQVFVFIGAVANTDWLGDAASMDRNGFIYTGDLLDADQLAAGRWPADRRPSTFETLSPGLFAVGDVRCGSTKRVASAVGEGSVAVQFVHRHVSASPTP